jgi:ribonuclease R
VIGRILAELGLEPAFPADVEAEAAAWVAAPGIDDPALTDLLAIPFVTIDGADSRDLDQAMHLSTDARGFRLRYALADAAYYVRPGSALFREALRRGASYYAPGGVVTMLPRSLCEGVISLNPDVVRRALVFDLRLDDAAMVKETRVFRARVKSRAKLSWDMVHDYLATPAGHPMAGREFADSLRLLPLFGRLRLAEAAARHVLRDHPQEIELRLAGRRLVSYVGRSTDVELYNAEMSILCNAEGGRLLAEGTGGDARTQAIYRIHPAPEPARLAALAALIEEVAVRHGQAWRWSPATPLSAFLASLPEDPRTARVVQAIKRQAILVNVRSTFAAEAGEHFGVGAHPYARFSSPMREVVGVFVHKELVEQLGLAPRAPAQDDEAIRAAVIESANGAKSRQRRLDDLVFERYLEQLFGEDARRPAAERRVRSGTIVGITPSKVHVTLDEPPADVKLYVRALGERARGPLHPSPTGAALLDEKGEVVFALGDEIGLTVSGRAYGRWQLAPVGRVA